MNELVEVDPAGLYLPSSRLQGADPAKLARHIYSFGDSVVGVPPPWARRCRDGLIQLKDGVTRCTRIAKLRPGVRINVLVVEELPGFDVSKFPTIGEMLP